MNNVALFCMENGIPESVAAAWRARGITGWTPLQEAAWREGAAREGESWLVAGPTSAGKGLVAEAAAIACLMRGRKVLWLAPTRALAMAVSRQLETALAGLGLRVSCATRDTPGEDARIYRGQFDLLVAVYEKAAAWLARQPHGLAEVGLVVADELTMLRDPERGARLDVLLTLIQASAYAPRRIGLTLPVAGLEAMARWWGGRLLRCDERPRPLHEGVLNLETGWMRWRNRAEETQSPKLKAQSSMPNGDQSEEPLATPEEARVWVARARHSLEDSDWPPLRTATAAVAAGLAARGEATMLFVASRALARHWAAGLAEAFELRLPGEAITRRARELAEREPTADHQLVARTLERGVGLHHADLTPAARRLVEEAFAGGEIDLLVATPTLAQGVNLAAINVVHWPERPEAAAAGWRAGALERWRFADQGGRAGRYGLGRGAGRSILVAWEARQAEALWRHYIEEPAEPIHSGLAGGELSAALLAALAGDVARTRHNLTDFFAGTLAGETAWREHPAELETRLERALTACREGYLIRETAGGWRLTGLGQICAAQGLEPETAAQLALWLEEENGLRPGADEPLAALCALALCAPAGLWPAGARPGRSPVAGELRAWFAGRDETPPGPLAALLEQPGGPAAAELAALEAAWRLALWIGPEPTGGVERRTGWPAGSLARAGEGLAWIASGAAALTLAYGGRLAAAQEWRTLAARLGAGVTREGAELALLHGEALGRGAIQSLCAEGLNTVQAVREASEAVLAQALGGDREAAKTLKRSVGKEIADCGLRIADFKDSRIAESETRNAITGSADALVRAFSENPQSAIRNPQSEGPVIEIDLKSPGVIKVGGSEVRLTPLTFDLLAALAEQPGRVLTREAIYQRLWPEGGPEAQQLDAHRRRLTSELQGRLGGQAARVVETVRGVGFRLNLPPRHVQLERG